MSNIGYTTQIGKCFCDDSRNAMRLIAGDSVDLVITSPPFALLRSKEYGNESQDQYIDWLAGFAREVHRILKPTGSFVLDLGGSYVRGKPVRSLYNFEVLIKFCKDLNFYLAEEFFWHNPSKLPSPIEWVNKRKIRVKDAVNTVWWFSKSEQPKANVKNVLVPYSSRMKTLLQDQARYFQARKRPSGHEMSHNFVDNGGAIPSNLLQYSNSESNSNYLRLCKALAHGAHPARFPSAIPEFFIKFLTDERDLVIDIFSGSNTTGESAEKLNRRWVSIDNEIMYVANSALRFLGSLTEPKIRHVHKQILDGKTVHIEKLQPARLAV